MWRRFDAFMQHWYSSMPDPWGDVVMACLGYTLGIGVIIGFGFYVA